MRGHRSLGHQHRVRGAHGPVFLGRKFELLVAHPFPGADQRRLDGDALHHLLFQLRQGRHRVIEIDEQRPGAAIVLVLVFDRRARRVLRRHGHFQRLGTRLPPLVPGMRSERHATDEDQRDRSVMRFCFGSGGHRTDALPHPLRPWRRGPVQGAEQRREHHANGARKQSARAADGGTDGGENRHGFPSEPTGVLAIMLGE